MCGLRCDLLWCCDAASWCCAVLWCCGAVSWCCDVLWCCDAASWCCDVLRCCGASFCCFCRSRSCCFCSLFHISSSFHAMAKSQWHTEMVLSARQAFQPPHIICMFFARHIQLCFRLSQVARPLGRGGASAGRGTPQYERSPVSGLYVS